MMEEERNENSELDGANSTTSRRYGNRKIKESFQK